MDERSVIEAGLTDEGMSLELEMVNEGLVMKARWTDKDMML